MLIYNLFLVESQVFVLLGLVSVGLYGDRIRDRALDRMGCSLRCRPLYGVCIRKRAYNMGRSGLMEFHLRETAYNREAVRFALRDCRLGHRAGRIVATRAVHTAFAYD